MGQAAAGFDGCAIECEADATLVQQFDEASKQSTCADLRGFLEIEGTSAVGAVTRLALAEALAAVVNRGARQGDQARVEVARSLGRRGADRTLRFSYSVRTSDVVAASVARAALTHEARRNGKRRLLPSFAAALRAQGELPGARSSMHNEHPEACGGLSVVEWTIECSAQVPPGIQRQTVPSRSDLAPQLPAAPIPPAVPARKAPARPSRMAAPMIGCSCGL
mmetsp:Transcript_1201/g.2048  ORF Transcript_1201/g.2048 Transcript_1201/m.2048 type:complete len:222 (-) Transcript_1201:62-727(-)|eukprot:CAMPEP_0169119426 /NCGR_PEP_ID=MMETSP1015-20121227/31549_1 /TAXON_ID=342587 /ORGANISM="Karlodinium micrum, Strain CCMP2283" /LENGTH=221 /DNA_ID=CAMNT_0009182303 /DNA_START=75 /DNA_END=743 /DNA_ORIENTATION=+